MAAVMLLTAAPLTGLNLTAQAKSSAASAQSHSHKKVTSVQKATLSKNGTKTVKCSTCKKVLEKKTIYKIASVKLKKTSYTYTGKTIKPSVVAKDSKGKTLKAGTDYTVSYKNNKTVGKATVTVTFKGNYSGTKTLSFSILPKIKASSAKTSVTVSWTKVPGAKTYKVALYNGKKLVKSVTSTKTSAKFTSLSSGKSYTVKLTALNGKKTVAAASATVKTTANNSVKAYRTKKLADAASKGTFLIKFTTNDEQLGSAPITLATKNGNLSVQTKIEGMDCRMLFLAQKSGKAPKVYLILDKLRAYCKMPSDVVSAGDMNLAYIFSDTAGSKITAKKVKQGQKTLVCESYTSKDGKKVDFYFDGETPVKRVEADKNGTKNVMYISKFTTSVPDSLLSIPKGYIYVDASFISSL